MAGGFNVDEDQINPLSPGRNNSIRDLVGRSKTTFRTFQGSRRGGYTVNGSKLERDFVHESIPLTVQAVPPIPRSPLPLTSDEDESGDNFPPPPLSLPDEFLSAQSSPVQFLAIRPFDDEEQAVAPPPFDIDVQQRSPLSRSVQIIDIGSKRGLPHSHFSPLVFTSRGGQGMFQLVDEMHNDEPDSDVQLLAYRITRRPSDLSPSQQRRHLNGHGPHPIE